MKRQHRRENIGALDHWCRACGQFGTRHRVDGHWLCCACYVTAGHQPAEWHPDCMAAYALRKTWR